MEGTQVGLPGHDPARDEVPKPQSTFTRDRRSPRNIDSGRNWHVAETGRLPTVRRALGVHPFRPPDGKTLTSARTSAVPRRPCASEVSSRLRRGGALVEALAGSVAPGYEVGPEVVLEKSTRAPRASGLPRHRLHDWDTMRAGQDRGLLGTIRQCCPTGGARTAPP